MFDVLVIGSGPGGYVAAIRCAQLGMKVACVEKMGALGGTCLNIGCIPSKALLHSTEFYWKLCNEARDLGIEVQKPQFNFAQMMGRKQKIVSGFNDGVGALFKKNRIVRYSGLAVFESNNKVRVGAEIIEAKNIIIATGSEPARLPFLPFDEKKIVSSTGALSLDRPPKRMIVIGAGIIGVELGSVYSRLGSEVIFIEFLDRICPTLDETLSKTLQEVLTRQKMKFYLSSKVTGAKVGIGETSLTVSIDGNSQLEMKTDVVLVSIGRKPYTEGLGLNNVGIECDAKGFIPIDGQFRTTVPNIYAIGDVVNGPMLAHKASEEGVAVAEIIAGSSPKIDYLAIPNVVYTSPEVASVGLTEAEAKANQLDYKIGTFPFKINSRARCTGEEEGLVKVIGEKTTDRLVGVHIIGAHASELIAEAALAMQKKCTVRDLAHTPGAHPTLAEAIKEAALAYYQQAIHK